MKQYCTGVHVNSQGANSCCHAHDQAYGVNGTGTRLQADQALRDCLIRNGCPRWLAWSVYGSVRAFGGAYFKRAGISMAGVAQRLLPGVDQRRGFGPADRAE